MIFFKLSEKTNVAELEFLVKKFTCKWLLFSNHFIMAKQCYLTK